MMHIIRKNAPHKRLSAKTGLTYHLLWPVLLVFFWSCYNPVKHIPPGNSPQGQSTTTAQGILYPVNPTRQICNISASQDPDLYPGCMLWLNFNGLQSIKVDTANNPGLDPNTDFGHHDHLFISDTSNTVKWNFAKPAFIEQEMQDPEWSYHPDYIAFLGKGADNQWDGYVVRISDKMVLKFNENQMIETSTPYVWVAPQIRSTAGTILNGNFGSNGFNEKDSIQLYFSTDSIIIAYNKVNHGIRDLYYVNYASANPAPVKLNKPQGRENLNADNPIISPDGKWITYQMYDAVQGPFSTYLQRLGADASPVLLSENGADPHWWKNPADNNLFILYSTKGGYITDKLEDFTDGSLGKTMLQRVLLFDFGRAQLLDQPFGLVDWPFKGGISKSGSFLATGYSYGYIYEIK